METKNEVEILVRQVRQRVEQIETNIDSIDAKLSALLWIVFAIGVAIVVAVIKL